MKTCKNCIWRYSTDCIPKNDYDPACVKHIERRPLGQVRVIK